MSEVAAKTPVPLGQKLAFGFGMLANQMFPAALEIFIVVLVQGLGVFPLGLGNHTFRAQIL